MKQYSITGMSCAACSARIEKAVSKVAGVERCSVNLLTNSMGVEGAASDSAIIAAVEHAGYGARLKTPVQQQSRSAHSAQDEALLTDHETPLLKKRLISSIILLIPLMYISMGHTMWGWKLPAFFEGNHVAMGLAELILAAVVLIINQKFFISGCTSLLHRAPNMDTLVALGSASAFVYSTCALFALTGAVAAGNHEETMRFMHEFYFETAAMIVTLITVGKLLEARAKGHTTDALKGLMKLAPKTAVILKDGEEQTVPIERVQRGTVFVVRPGEHIPVDGIVLKGSSAVNEAALTGESIPVDKSAGSTVSAATVNISGFITCEATRVGEDTTLSHIIQMVSDAAATKAPIAKVADRVSGIFVPVVMSIALITFAVWLMLGESIGTALTRAVAVLVISCPCALGLATPVAIMVGNGKGAKNGILFKTAAALEALGKTTIVVLDKTGTITAGEPRVTAILPASGVDEEELLTLAFTLEKKSEHPLAKAIVRAAQERNLVASEVIDFAVTPGNGLSGATDKSILFGGNAAWMDFCGVRFNDSFLEAERTLTAEGKTLLYFGEKHTGQNAPRPLGIIAVADTIKEDSARAVTELQEMGMTVVMLTGDNEKTAKAIGAQVGVDHIRAGVLPEGKEAVIRELQQQGNVCMVGDGINDAPALTRANTGIAIGAGSDIAIDAADIVLIKSRPLDIPAAIRLSRATLKNIRQNLFWAFVYNSIGIPLAAGVFTKLFGWQLNPMFGAAAMSLSSFCVVTNALRLNFCTMYKTPPVHTSAGSAHPKSNDMLTHVQPPVPFQRENREKTIAIHGMMCTHCEQHVTKALTALDFIETVTAHHEKKTAIITLKENATFNEEAVKASIEKAGYEYHGVL